MVMLEVLLLGHRLVNESVENKLHLLRNEQWNSNRLVSSAPSTTPPSVSDPRTKLVSGVVEACIEGVVQYQLVCRISPLILLACVPAYSMSARTRQYLCFHVLPLLEVAGRVIAFKASVTRASMPHATHPTRSLEGKTVFSQNEKWCFDLQLGRLWALKAVEALNSAATWPLRSTLRYPEHRTFQDMGQLPVRGSPQPSKESKHEDFASC